MRQRDFAHAAGPPDQSLPEASLDLVQIATPSADSRAFFT
jgi:hypothetical protein